MEINEKFDMENEILEVLKKHGFVDDDEIVYQVKLDLSVDELPMVTVKSTKEIRKPSWREKIEEALTR